MDSHTNQVIAGMQPGGSEGVQRSPEIMFAPRAEWTLEKMWC